MKQGSLSTRTVHVGELDLDLLNYRLPINVENEDEAISYMLRNEKVFQLAEEILKYGYLENEIPLVVREDSRLKVVEGNRRITALKILNDPLVAEKFGISVIRKRERLIDKYKEEFASVPSRIKIGIANSRQELQPHIARLHTKMAKKQWSTEQQANFYYAQIRSGVSIQELKATYGSSGRLKRLLQTASFSHLIAELSGRLDEETLRRLASIKPSPLERVLAVEKIRTLVGLEFTSDGLLAPDVATVEDISKSLTEENLRALKRMAQLMTSGKPPLNTRHPATNGDPVAIANVVHYLVHGEFPNEHVDTPLDAVEQSKNSKHLEPNGNASPTRSSTPAVEKGSNTTVEKRVVNESTSTCDENEKRPANAQDGSELQDKLGRSLRNAPRNDADRLGNKYAFAGLQPDDSALFEDVNALIFGILEYGKLPKNSVSRQAKLYLLAPALRPIFELTLMALNNAQIADFKLPNAPHAYLGKNVEYVARELSDSSFLSYVSREVPDIGGYHPLKSLVDGCDFGNSAGIAGNSVAHTSYRNLSEQRLKEAFNEAVLFALLCQRYVAFRDSSSTR